MNIDLLEPELQEYMRSLGPCFPSCGRGDAAFVADIIERAARVTEYVGTRTLKEFKADHLTRDAVLTCISNTVVAYAHISPSRRIRPHRGER